MIQNTLTVDAPPVVAYRDAPPALPVNVGTANGVVLTGKPLLVLTALPGPTQHVLAVVCNVILPVLGGIVNSATVP